MYSVDDIPLSSLLSLSEELSPRTEAVSVDSISGWSDTTLESADSPRADDDLTVILKS